MEVGSCYPGLAAVPERSKAGAGEGEAAWRPGARGGRP